MSRLHNSLGQRIGTLKANVPIEEAIPALAGIDLKFSGNDASPSDDICPCGEHKGNFHINVSGGYCNCFTPGCELKGDIVDFTKKYLNVSAGEATEKLEALFAEALNDAEAKVPVTGLPVSGSSHEERIVRGIQNPTDADFKAMAGYQTAFRWGLTSQSFGYGYLTQKRLHSPAILAQEGIGYVDQNLSYRLQARTSPKTQEMLARYGMLTTNGADVARQGVVTFPLKDREGRICGFRFKDPSKQFHAQQRKEGILNGVLFLGEHTLKGLPAGARVALVEGEHDWLSMREAGFAEGLLATCGQISKAQVEWLKGNLNGYQLVTVMDSDHAGDAYRVQIDEQLAELNPQQYVPTAKDPDAFLKSGGSLEKIFVEGNVWKR